MSYLAATLLALAIMALQVDGNWLAFVGFVAAALVSFGAPRLGASFFDRAEKMLHGFAAKRRLAVIGVGLLALAVRLMLMPVLPVPEPAVSDEFSHLLLADTLAHGRLTNPTHPFWRHFETIHVIQHPTYNSMYFPGPALALSLGQLVAGIPWVGVLLASAAMCSAICWMLQGWLPPAWALYGGIFAVFRFAVFGYWVNSYWGGAVAALAGALVLGAWPRVQKRMRMRDAVVMGLGAALLVNCRPFEGGALCLTVAGAIVLWLWRLPRPTLKRAVVQVVVPLLLIDCAAAGAMGYYFCRVTGSPFRLPYQVNQQTYGWPVTLPWFDVKPRHLEYPDMQSYFDWERREHRKLRFNEEALFLNCADAILLWSFFIGPVFSLPLCMLPRVLHQRRMRFLALVGAVVAACAGLVLTRYPHYLAPATCVIVALLVQCIRHVRAVSRRRPWLLAMTRFVPLIAMALAFAYAALPALRRFETPAGRYFSWSSPGPPGAQRAELVRQLDPNQQHLIIVRYAPHHDFMKEWIANAADIDSAHVVWARDLGPTENQKLIRYFAGREAWLFEPDEAPPRLSPYPVQ